ncbi:hypothetical protein ACFL6S_00915 [Candidatus Poribacteria bacterium]
MGIINALTQRARKLNIFDLKLAQGAAMFSALTIAKLLPEIMTTSIWWFIGLMILCVIKPFYAFWLE